VLCVQTYLIQIGNLGILKAAEKYNHEKGRFISFSRFSIRREILYALAVQSRTVNLGYHQDQRNKKYDLTLNILYLKLVSYISGILIKYPLVPILLE
jgi:DNA-directed RNA polymerase sigma subunit (sigma70/sigma32)